MAPMQQVLERTVLRLVVQMRRREDNAGSLCTLLFDCRCDLLHGVQGHVPFDTVLVRQAHDPIRDAASFAGS